MDLKAKLRQVLRRGLRIVSSIILLFFALFFLIIISVNSTPVKKRLIPVIESRVSDLTNASFSLSGYKYILPVGIELRGIIFDDSLSHASVKKTRIRITHFSGRQHALGFSLKLDSAIISIHKKSLAARDSAEINSKQKKEKVDVNWDILADFKAKNLAFVFHSDDSIQMVNAQLKEAELDEIRVLTGHKLVSWEKIYFAGVNVKLELNNSDTADTSNNSVAWRFEGDLINLQEVKSDVRAKSDSIFLSTTGEEITLRGIQLDPGNQKINATKINLKNLSHYQKLKQKTDTNAIADQKGEFKWHIDVNKIDLQKIHFHQKLLPGNHTNSDTIAEEIAVTDIGMRIKDLVLRSDKVSSSLSEISFVFNEQIQITGSSLKIFTTNSSSAIDVFLNSQFGQVEAQLKSEGNLLAWSPEYHLPNSNIELQLREIQLNQLKDILPDSIKYRPFPQETLNASLRAHVENSWAQLDTFSLEIGRDLAIWLGGAVDQYQNSDSLLIKGSLLGKISGSIMEYFPELNSSGLENLKNENLLIDAQFIADNNSVHTHSKISSQSISLPVQVSFYKLDTSFLVQSQDLRINADTLFSFPLQIDTGSFIVSGSLGRYPKIDFKGEISSYEVKSILLKDFTFSGDLDDKVLEANLNSNDSILELSSDITVELGNTIKIISDSKLAFQKSFEISKKEYTRLNTTFEVKAWLARDCYQTELGINNLKLLTNEDEYAADSISVFFASGPQLTEAKLQSNPAELHFSYPGSLDSLLKEFAILQKNFRPDSIYSGFSSGIMPHARLNIQVNNHPLVNGFLARPKIAFENISITYGADEEEKISAGLIIDKLNYAGNGVEKVEVKASEDRGRLLIQSQLKGMKLTDFIADYFSLDAAMGSNSVHVNARGYKNSDIRFFTEAILEHDSGRYMLTVPSDSLIFFGQSWQVADSGVIYNHPSKKITGELELSSGSRLLRLTEKEEGAVCFELSRMPLRSLAYFLDEIEKSSGMVNGSVCLTNGTDLRRSLVCDLSIDSLEIDEFQLGNYTADAKIFMSDTLGFLLDSRVLREDELLFRADGAILRDDFQKSVFSLKVADLSLAPFQKFLSDNLKELEGELSGELSYDGTKTKNLMQGEVSFKNLMVNPVQLNTRFTFRDSQIKFAEQRLNFSRIHLYDEYGKHMLVDGFIEARKQKKPFIQLSVTGDSLQIMNVPETKSASFFGRVVASSQLGIKGNLTSPDVQLGLRFIEGTDFTFKIQEKLIANHGEGVVVFAGDEVPDTVNMNMPIVSNAEKNLDLKAKVTIDPKTVFRLIYDQNMLFEVELSGEGDLNYEMTKSGSETMIGRYSVKSGNAALKLQGLAPRNFVISPQSSIRWDGLATDPMMNIIAYYRTKGSYQNPSSGGQQTIVVDYDVYFTIKDRMSNPQIDFDLRTEDEYMTSVLNNMPEEQRLRQAINILLLGQIVDEHSKVSGAGLVAERLNQFWASQLNDAAEKNVQGVQVSVDINSYTAYTASGAHERTDLSYEVSKEIWNDRATVKVGGYVRSGGGSPEESADRLIGDVSLEYQLKQDKNLYGKVFSKNKYEGILEGEIQTTGVGILYRQTYSSLNEIWLGRQKSKAAKEK